MPFQAGSGRPKYRKGMRVLNVNVRWANGIDLDDLRPEFVGEVLHGDHARTTIRYADGVETNVENRHLVEVHRT